MSTFACKFRGDVGRWALWPVVVGMMGLPACQGGESSKVAYEDGNTPPVTAKAKMIDFSKSVARAANAYCKCRPPTPPIFPPELEDDDEAIHVCVAKQAAILLGKSMKTIRIAGPAPVMDEAQYNMVVDYLVERGEGSPDANRCKLADWTQAVANATQGTRSAGTASLRQEVWRWDKRHPSQWSDTGFMAASTKRELSTDADPWKHTHSYSEGSQVWTSTATKTSGASFAASHATKEGEMTPDLCIVYSSSTRIFEAREATSVEDCREATNDDIAIHLQVGYRYHAKSTPVFIPSDPEVPEEKEAISLGFRPDEYRGVVITHDYPEPSNFQYTAAKSITYATNTCQLKFSRPAFKAVGPFEGLDLDIVLVPIDHMNGVQCTNAQTDTCLSCALLSTAAALCVKSLLGNPKGSRERR